MYEEMHDLIIFFLELFFWIYKSNIFVFVVVVENVFRSVSITLKYMYNSIFDEKMNSTKH